MPQLRSHALSEKNEELCYDNVNFKRKRGGLEKIHFTHVWSKRKSKINFFFKFIAFGLQVICIPWKKNITPMTRLRRLVENRESLFNMNLKYHVNSNARTLFQ